MPFDFEEYATSCRTWDDETLQREDQKYTRLITQHSAAMVVGMATAPFTFGISLMGAVVFEATLVNAASKLSIIKNETMRRKKHMLDTRLKNFFGDIALGSTEATFDDDDTTFDNDNSVPSSASKVSSMSSLSSHGNILALISQFKNLLIQDDVLKSLFQIALRDPKIGRERLQRNLRWFLKLYARDLKLDVCKQEHLAIVRFISRRSGAVAIEVCEDLGSLTEKPNRFTSLPDRSRGREEIILISDSEEDNISSGHESDDGDDEIPSQLSQYRKFIVSSVAWNQLRERCTSFVFPSVQSRIKDLVTAWSNPLHKYHALYLRYNLGCVGAELQGLIPETLHVELDNKHTISNMFKGIVEDLTQERWQWWPFKPREHLLLHGENRILWLCSCRTTRSFIVPSQFATFISRLVSQAHPPEGNIEESNESGSLSGGHLTSSINPAFPISRQAQLSVGTRAIISSPSSSGEGTVISINASYQRTLHIQLVVPFGRTYALSQIQVPTAQNSDYLITDTGFFQQLRLEYESLRGFFLAWFSIWIYSHCDFYMFEKWEERAYAPKKPDFPKADDKDYEYRPKPMDYIPPISSHEFEMRFYACQEPCRNLLHRCRLVQCRQYCKHTSQALDVLPKRLAALEEGSPVRLHFWGIFAREQPSFFRFFIYCFICMSWTLSFMIWWLLPRNHPSDLQNATTPLLLMAAVISLLLTAFTVNVKVIFTSQEVISTSAPSKRAIDESRIVVKFLPTGVQASTRREYNRILTTSWIWEQLAPAENVSLSHADSIICANSPHTIDDFLEYDFIAAPYDKWVGENTSDGLSLRNRTMTLDIVKAVDFGDITRSTNPQFDVVDSEEQWLYQLIKDLTGPRHGGSGPRLPSREVATQFFVGKIWHERGFGYQGLAGLNALQKEEMDRWCPEYRLAIEGLPF